MSIELDVLESWECSIHILCVDSALVESSFLDPETHFAAGYDIPWEPMKSDSDFVTDTCNNDFVDIR